MSDGSSSSRAVHLPDFPQVEQLRRRLWTEREIGRAAVMVGAGFSRNAVPLVASAPPFPLWATLAERFYDALHPITTLDPPARAAQAAASGGVLRLAEEYQAAFGRESLHELVARTIPDEQYLPGELHRLLLELPWSDVFTTNYDTLLERSRRDVPERRYDLVLTTEDLPNAVQPRIVKLHGSLPSHRPLVLVEEDYRTYPRRLAPFVNTVQQSLMENTFVLLGFSGDDPNFLNWIGWVRDNLGASCPPIYLCGVLDLASSARRVLELRGVVPIDLGPMFSPAEYPNGSERHRKAMRWLLLTLASGEPSQVITWPRTIVRPAHQGEDLPPIPAPPPALEVEPVQPAALRPGRSMSEPAPPDDLPALAALWRKNRTLYPGWVVLPEQNRATLWTYTQNWMHVVATGSRDLNPPDDIDLIFELNWRLEQVMVPLPELVAIRVQEVLARFSPFPEIGPAAYGSIHPGSREHAELPWERIRSQWLDLAFAWIRHARETGRHEQWQSWMEQLRPLVGTHAEWKARWFHERCIRALYQADPDELAVALAQWAEHDSPPMWRVRRAALLAETGHVVESIRTATDALARIRTRHRTAAEDYSSLSEEGWAIVLLEITRFARDVFSGPTEDLHGGRLEKLERTRCNPHVEMRVSEERLRGPVPEPPIQLFWPEERRSHTDSAEYLSRYVPAFRLLRSADQGGRPFRAGLVVTGQEEAISAALWIAPLYPVWATDVVLRVGNQKQVQNWFDVVRVARMPQDAVDALFDRLHAAVTVFTRQLAGQPRAMHTVEGQFAASRFTSYLSALGKLAFRLRAEDLEVLLESTIALYSSEFVRNDHGYYDSLGVLVRNVITNSSPSILRSHLKSLIELPVTGTSGFQVAVPEFFPDLFRILSPEQVLGDGPDEGAGTFSPFLSTLINLAGGVNGAEARRSASYRLWLLDHAGYLGQDERSQFSAALWSQVDDQTGLPTGTDFLPSAFLALSEANREAVAGRIREYLTLLPIPRITATGIYKPGEPVSMTLTRGAQVNFVRAWITVTSSTDPAHRTAEHRFEWTASEVARLLRQIIAWWDDEKELLDLSGDFRTRVANSAFAAIVPMLRIVILPRLDLDDPQLLSEAERLIREMDDRGVETATALPEWLRIRPDATDAVARQLRRALSRKSEGAVAEVAEAVYYWAIASVRGDLPPVPADLIDELVSRIVARRSAGLSEILEYIGQVFIHTPDLISSGQRDELITALEYLLAETRMPDELERAKQNSENLDDDLEDLPRRRAAAARLAALLWQQAGAEAAAHRSHNILEEWRTAALGDPFPQVRQAWRSVEA